MVPNLLVLNFSALVKGPNIQKYSRLLLNIIYPCELNLSDCSAAIHSFLHSAIHHWSTICFISWVLVQTLAIESGSFLQMFPEQHPWLLKRFLGFQEAATFYKVAQFLQNEWFSPTRPIEIFNFSMSIPSWVTNNIKKETHLFDSFLCRNQRHQKIPAGDRFL